MAWLSIEIKARCADPARIRKILRAQGADFKGLDRQIDTYFHVPQGRLKLREGNIEKALIFYKRENRKNSKRCDAVLHAFQVTAPVKTIFREACGILTIVDKRREIYFLRNVEPCVSETTGARHSGETPPKHPRRNAAGFPLAKSSASAGGALCEGGVKFHIDRVKGLGNFVEIEAQDRTGRMGPAKLKAQCEWYQRLLGIRKADLLADSYSDQLLAHSS